MSDQKFIELETKIAHQEFAIEEMQESLLEQSKEIDLLKNAIRKLDEKLKSAKSGGLDIGPADEKSPHY